MDLHGGSRPDWCSKAGEIVECAAPLLAAVLSEERKDDKETAGEELRCTAGKKHRCRRTCLQSACRRRYTKHGEPSIKAFEIVAAVGCNQAVLGIRPVAAR